MEVTFTKTDARRYALTVTRTTGPELATRQGPGYDSYLPHDIVHFVVEAETGIRGGVFGRLASGECGILWPADPHERRRQSRRRKPPSPAAQADMARSERWAGACQALWELRSGRRAELPRWLSPEQLTGLDPLLLQRVLARFDEIGPLWHALPVGGHLTLPWPYPEGRRHAALSGRDDAPARTRPASRPGSGGRR